MIFKNKKAIFFDLDGTLIDSVPDLAQSVNFMLKKLNREEFSEDIIRLWVGNGAQTLVKRALSANVVLDSSLDEIFCNKALNIFLEHYEQNLCNKTKLYPNVTTALEYLYKNQYNLSIITNKPFKFISPILQTLQIQHYFTHFLGADSLVKKKPDPLPILHLVEILKIDLENCIMIGDSKNDILAANNANIDSIGVSYGYNYDENISKYKPTFVVKDFKELMECF